MNGKAVTALIVLLLAGGGLAIALSGSDDEDGGSATTPQTSTSAKPKTETEKKEEPKQEEEKPKTDDEEIEEAINQYIAESSDTQTVECDLVIDGVCIQNETGLTVEDIQVKGDQARAELKNGGAFNLQQEGGQWKISGFEPSKPDRSGSVEAPSRPEVEKPEVEKPERPKMPER